MKHRKINIIFTFPTIFNFFLLVWNIHGANTILWEHQVTHQQASFCNNTSNQALAIITGKITQINFNSHLPWKEAESVVSPSHIPCMKPGVNPQTWDLSTMKQKGFRGTKPWVKGCGGMEMERGGKRKGYPFHAYHLFLRKIKFSDNVMVRWKGLIVYKC